MSEDQVNIGLQHRLIGAEDVDWDKDCKNEQTEFLTPFSVTKPLSKINSEHVPLDKETYLALGGAKTIGEALRTLKRTGGGGGGGGSSSGMEEDTTVEITSEYSTPADIKENLIDGMERDLGGNVLTYVFAANLARSFSNPLVFEGFYDGKLVIDLNDNTISLAANVAGVIRLLNCQCIVEIKNGTISFAGQSTASGVTAEGCSSVKCTDISFVNNSSSSNSYAFYGLSTDCHFSSCSVTNGLFYKGGERSNNAWSEVGGKWSAILQQRVAVDDALDKITAIQEGWRDLFADNYIVSRGTNSSGVSWVEYNSGLLIQWGSTKITQKYFAKNANGVVDSSASKIYAKRITLAKKYSNATYFVQASVSFDCSYDSKLVDGNLYAVPIEPKGTRKVLIPKGEVSMDNKHFIIIDYGYSTATDSANTQNSELNNYEWLTIGIIHDDDKTDVEELIGE